jgi:hypothetical protein
MWLIFSNADERWDIRELGVGGDGRIKLYVWWMQPQASVAVNEGKPPLRVTQY